MYGEQVVKRILICIIAVFVFFAQSLCAQQTAADQTAQVSIKLYDRTIYYPDSAQNNPVYVHVSIVNKGQNTLRFKLADDRAFSIDFTAFDARSTKLAQKVSLIR